MFVVFGWLDVLVFELKSNLGPYFANFEVWVHLDDLHLLLFMCVQVVFVETNPVKNAENDQPDVVLLNFFLDPVDQVSLHTCFSQVL